MVGQRTFDDAVEPVAQHAHRCQAGGQAQAMVQRADRLGHFAAAIRDELRRAGFVDIRIETREEVSRSPSARDAAIAYCQGTPLRNEIEARDASLLQIATDRAAQAIADRHGEGAVVGKIQAHVIVAAG